MSFSSDIKRIMEIFDAAKNHPVAYREFEKPPLRAPDTSFDRDAPESSRKTPESVFDLPNRPEARPNLFFIPSHRPQKGSRPFPAAQNGQTREQWPALEAALLELVPAISGAPADWPVLLFTGMAGGCGRSTLLAGLSIMTARQGRPCLLIDLNETNLFPYLLMEFRKEEFIRVGRTWTLYTYEPTATSMIVVRPEPGESALEENEAGALSRLKDEIVDQAAGLLPPSATRTPLVLVDSPPMTRQRLYEASLFSSLILSPVKPDLPSLISIKEMEKDFESFEREQARYCERFYVLNRFVAEHPLHQDIFGIFRQILSRRLCPVVIPEDPTVELALAKGASLMDAFSTSPAATSIAEAATWIGSKLGK